MGSRRAEEISELRRDVMLLEVLYNLLRDCLFFDSPVDEGLRVEKLLFETEKLKEERDKIRLEKEMLEMEHRLLLLEKEKLEKQCSVVPEEGGNSATENPS